MQKLVTGLGHNKLQNSIGIILTGSGGATLAGSYLMSSIILTFAGLGLILWGIIFYMSKPSLRREELVYYMSVSTMKALNRIITSLGYKGNGTYFFSRVLNADTPAYLFVAADEKDFSTPDETQLSNGMVFCKEPRGIVMPAPVLDLTEFLEKQLSVDSLDMELIQANLPRLLVEDLKSINNLEIRFESGKISLTIKDESWARICKNISNETKNGGHVICPVCSTFALLFSKAIGKPVTIVANNITDITIQTSYMVIEG